MGALGQLKGETDVFDNPISWEIEQCRRCYVCAYIAGPSSGGRWARATGKGIRSKGPDPSVRATHEEEIMEGKHEGDED